MKRLLLIMLSMIGVSSASDMTSGMSGYLKQAFNVCTSAGLSVYNSVNAFELRMERACGVEEFFANKTNRLAFAVGITALQAHLLYTLDPFEVFEHTKQAKKQKEYEKVAAKAFKSSNM